MLYVTTKQQRDPYTSHHALCEEYAPDGGNYAPLRLPVYNREEILAMGEKNACEIMADMLNLFFGGKLTSWDIQLCIGQKPFSVQSMPHKIHFAEVWNNPRWSFDFAVQTLAEHMGLPAGENCGNWTKIAVLIGYLFCIFADLQKRGVPLFEKETDIAVPVCDFSAAMAVLYGKQMGLPIGKVLCGTNKNGGLWDLLNHGQFRTGAEPEKTDTPYCDVTVPEHLADAILQLQGGEEARRFVGCVAFGETFTQPDDLEPKLCDSIYAAVIGRKRMYDVIASVYKTNQYLMDPYSALAYGALQDYRASGGNISDAVVLSLWNYADHRDVVAKAIGAAPEEIRQQYPWN